MREHVRGIVPGGGLSPDRQRWVAIANSRLISLDERGVTFKWKDDRAKGKTKYKTMTLGADEFMRRFLLHVLLTGFHRIRHYGLIANAGHRDHRAAYRGFLPRGLSDA